MSVPYAGGYLGLGNSFTSQNRLPVGGWVELGRTTLGSSGTSISVASLADKRYLMYLYNGFVITNTYEHSMRLNNDSGSNYAIRRSVNGAADSTSVSIANMNLESMGTFDTFDVGYLSNLSTKEKLLNAHSVYGTGTGAANVPSRNEITGKHAQTSNPINRIDIIRTAGVGSVDTGTELVVLGWDPADTHTTNFWEELASDDLSGGAGDLLTSGTITAKKYLWIQYYLKATGGNIVDDLTFNNTTGNEYSIRRSFNGGAESSATSQALVQPSAGAIVTGNAIFANIFIVNNSAREKLCISHTVNQGTAGAANAPDRNEAVFKWDSTSAQITEIDLDNSQAGNYDTTSFLKVWGSN